VKLQERDGSWKLNSKFSSLVGKKVLQIKAAAKIAKENLPDSDTKSLDQFCDPVPLFSTMLAVEVVSRGLSSLDSTPAEVDIFWIDRATNWITYRAKQHKQIFQDQVIGLLNHVESSNTKTCPDCNTARPKQIRICPNCYNEEHNGSRQPSIESGDYQMDLTQSNPAPIHTINWEDTQGCSWISGGLGSFGVIVVDLPEGVVVGKCAGNRFIHEFLGYKLAKFSGLRVPEMRMVSRETPEGESFLGAINSARFTNSQDAQRIGKYYLYPKFFIMEFIPSQSCLVLPHEKSNQLLDNQSFLNQLANVMAFDVLINNYDRMPLIWANEGNPENILLQWNATGDDISVVCIDQFVTEVRDSFYQKYANSIQNFVRGCQQVRSGNQISDETRQLFSRLNEFFMINLQVQLSDDHLLTLANLVLKELERICPLFAQLTLDELLQDEDEQTKVLFLDDPRFTFVQSVAQSCSTFLQGS